MQVHTVPLSEGLAVQGQNSQPGNTQDGERFHQDVSSELREDAAYQIWDQLHKAALLVET